MSLPSLLHEIEKSFARFMAETNARNQSRVNSAMDRYRRAKEESLKPPKKVRHGPTCLCKKCQEKKAD